MTLHHDLLEQASHLATREPRKPKQASLRRGVSAAYYALFHLLAAEGAGLLSPKSPAGIRRVVGRAFDHGQMRQVCSGFMKWSGGQTGNKNIPEATQTLLTKPLDPRLVTVLNAFVDLQEARHQADYDLAKAWLRTEVLDHVQSARDAFSDWAQVRKTDGATVFLTALLLQKHWAR